MKEIDVEPKYKGSKMFNRAFAVKLFSPSIIVQFWEPHWEPLKFMKNDIGDTIREGLKDGED